MRPGGTPKVPSWGPRPKLPKAFSRGSGTPEMVVAVQVEEPALGPVDSPPQALLSPPDRRVAHAAKQKNMYFMVWCNLGFSLVLLLSFILLLILVVPATRKEEGRLPIPLLPLASPHIQTFAFNLIKPPGEDAEQWIGHEAPWITLTGPIIQSSANVIWQSLCCLHERQLLCSKIRNHLGVQGYVVQKEGATTELLVQVMHPSMIGSPCKFSWIERGE